MPLAGAAALAAAWALPSQKSTEDFKLIRVDDPLVSMVGGGSNKTN